MNSWTTKQVELTHAATSVNGSSVYWRVTVNLKIDQDGKVFAGSDKFWLEVPVENRNYTAPPEKDKP